MARAWVGTSGYDYDHWKGEVYPEDTRKKDRLACFAEQFDALEVNNTFYGLPKREHVEAWTRTFREHHSGGFRFFFKGSRYITHTKFLKEPRRTPLHRLFDPSKAAGAALAGFLWQLPGRWRVDIDRLRDFIEDLAEVSEPEWKHAFEFRHESWFTEDVFNMLEKRGYGVVIADMPYQVLAPGMGARSIPRPKVKAPLTADFVYLRKHGPKGDFGGEYGAGVGTDAGHVKRWLREGKDVYAFYNNDPEGAAARDAKRLARRVSGT